MASDRFLPRAIPLLNVSLFPGQLRMTLGESNYSVPAFFAAHPEVVCDLVSIDGNHNIQYVKLDWRNFKDRMAPDGLVLFDDVPWWSRMFVQGRSIYEPELHAIGCLSLPGRADDDESLHDYSKLVRAGKRNASADLRERRWGHSMVASDGFCVARHTAAADERHAWAVQPSKRKGGVGVGGRVGGATVDTLDGIRLRRDETHLNAIVRRVST